jgi:transcription elongation factor Elf1
MGYKVKTNFYPEICCDHCNQVIHNHFNCPICNRFYAGTSIYREVFGETLNFHCESCGSKFRVEDFHYEDCEIEILEINKKEN